MSEARSQKSDVRSQNPHLLAIPKQVKDIEGDVPDSPALLLLGQEAELCHHLRTGSGLHPEHRKLASEASF